MIILLAVRNILASNGNVVRLKLRDIAIPDPILTVFLVLTVARRPPHYFPHGKSLGSTESVFLVAHNEKKNIRHVKALNKKESRAL